MQYDGVTDSKISHRAVFQLLRRPLIRVRAHTVSQRPLAIDGCHAGFRRANLGLNVPKFSLIKDFDVLFGSVPSEDPFCRRFMRAPEMENLLSGEGWSCYLGQTAILVRGR